MLLANFIGLTLNSSTLTVADFCSCFRTGSSVLFATIGAWWIFRRNIANLQTSSVWSPRAANTGKHCKTSQTDGNGNNSSASSRSLEKKRVTFGSRDKKLKFSTKKYYNRTQVGSFSQFPAKNRWELRRLELASKAEALAVVTIGRKLLEEPRVPTTPPGTFYRCPSTPVYSRPNQIKFKY